MEKKNRLTQRPQRAQSPQRKVNSHAEDDFAELGAGVEVGVGGGGLGEREDAVDNRLEAACGDELHHRLELGLRAHVGAEQRELAAEEEAQVDPGVEAGGGAAGYEPAARSGTSDAFVPDGSADMLGNAVHTAWVGDADDCFDNLPAFVRVEGRGT